MTAKQGKSTPPRPGGRSRKSQEARRSAKTGETKAVVDIGSNSIKLRVVRRRGKGLHTLIDTTEVVRLGKGIESGALSEEPLSYGVEVVDRLVRLAGEMGAVPRLVGTMALRVARNADEFVRRVRERTGLTAEILSGEEEARLAWLGAVYGLGATKGNVAVFDTGGGSTEFIFGSDTRIVRARSLTLGAVRLTEKFFDADPVLPGSVERAKKHIEDQFILEGPDFTEKVPDLSVIGLGGGVVALASVKQGFSSLVPRRLNGLFLKRSDIREQIETYASRTLAERMRIPGLPPKRADIVLASACIVECALEALGVESFRVSINGLRHGLLLEMFGAIH